MYMPQAYGIHCVCVRLSNFLVDAYPHWLIWNERCNSLLSAYGMTYSQWHWLSVIENLGRPICLQQTAIELNSTILLLCLPTCIQLLKLHEVYISTQVHSVNMTSALTVVVWVNWLIQQICAIMYVLPFSAVVKKSGVQNHRLINTPLLCTLYLWALPTKVYLDNKVFVCQVMLKRACIVVIAQPVTI